MSARVTRFAQSRKLASTGRAWVNSESISVQPETGAEAADAGSLVWEMSVQTGPRTTERLRIYVDGDDLRALRLGIDRLDRARAAIRPPTP